ncbi:glutamine amidotransferase-related protein [Polluticaenibacter yanchengensis]|uniref:Gamma-glutamyl-gamma-aminobutyrate hydrolase family protein n=1 Tax=Polluticaenibacter yanchengensis TaxID=3014562 RepID=A0ABT4UKC8_9BACT|nr:gamma-glutamyl-gamma-aminobutyrate hydrolase family protein [Chitinophagaceae bacterium LY-5]
MKIHFIQHEIYEAPGAYLVWAENNGHQVRFSKVFANDRLPFNIDDIDMLIIMGGPQSPDTTMDECTYFNAEAEMAVIRKCIEAGKTVIGVCLGAQLIGQSLGAAYQQSPEKEIGNFPITLTQDGVSDNYINHFPQTVTVGHWHNDMPGLTSGSKILASSIGCPRQIIKYQDNVYGFQCHMELTTELVTLLIDHEIGLEEKSLQYNFIQAPVDIIKYDYSEMNQNLYTFLDKLAKAAL